MGNVSTEEEYGVGVSSSVVGGDTSNGGCSSRGNRGGSGETI